MNWVTGFIAGILMLISPALGFLGISNVFVPQKIGIPIQVSTSSQDAVGPSQASETSGTTTATILRSAYSLQTRDFDQADIQLDTTPFSSHTLVFTLTAEQAGGGITNEATTSALRNVRIEMNKKDGHVFVIDSATYFEVFQLHTYHQDMSLEQQIEDIESKNRGTGYDAVSNEAEFRDFCILQKRSSFDTDVYVLDLDPAHESQIEKEVNNDVIDSLFYCGNNASFLTVGDLLIEIPRAMDAMVPHLLTSSVQIK